jgi:xylulokinase
LPINYLRIHTDAVSDSVSVLGIDLGTQSVKVAAVRDGSVLASATRHYDVVAPKPGWAQTDPQDWLHAVNSAVEEVLAHVDTPQAVGLSGQMHGVVTVDAALQPLTSAVIWADGRSAAQAEEIHRQLGAHGLARLGSAAFPGFMGPTVAWLSHHEPDVMRSARWLLSPKDYVRAYLTGTVATDVSDASGTLLLDVVSGQWSSPALSACGVDPRLLPPLVPSAAQAGVITDGPLAGIPIAAGGADTACVIHGLGLSAGQGYLGLGSGSQIVSVCDEPVVDPTLRTHTFDVVGAPGDGWYRLAAVQSGGLVLGRVLAWLAATDSDVSAAMTAGIQPSDPVFVPFLAGERTPYLDPHLRGSWQDLSLETDRLAMIRSVFEGLAYTVAVAAQAMADVTPRDPVSVLGGGSRDRRYLELIANTTGWCLAPLSVSDGAVFGAARLASDMIGRSMPGILDEEVASDVVVPQPSAIQTERFARWQKCVNATLST